MAQYALRAARARKRAEGKYDFQKQTIKTSAQVAPLYKRLGRPLTELSLLHSRSLKTKVMMPVTRTAVPFKRVGSKRHRRAASRAAAASSA
jgi:hypothetical protein